MRNILVFMLIGGLLACSAQQPAVTNPPPSGLNKWEDYFDKGSNGKYIDFSAVGVHYAEKAIAPKITRIFKVEDFGAIANDNIEDRAAIQKAIHAAEKAGGGTVLFSDGRYLINEQPGRMTGIRISTSNVRLLGTGMATGNTELFMRYPLQPKDPRKMWTTPPMIKFQPANSTAPSTAKVGKYIAESTVIADAEQGSHYIQVAHPERFKANAVVTIDMQNPAANDAFLHGKQPRKIWQTIVNKGVRAQESFEILKVAGKRLYLKQPLITKINAAYHWSIRWRPSIQGVGVENLRFIGNFTDEFVHHKNAEHDSGYTAINLTRTRHSWVKQVYFKNVSVAATTTGGVANSMMLNVIDGTRGHLAFNINFGTRNLVGLNLDITDKGQWHGPGASHLSVGNVIWRFVSPQSRGIDSHAGFPRYTLIDQVQTKGFNGWGGSYKNLPNHLEGMVFWNLQQTGDTLGKANSGGFNFWDTDKPDSQKYGFFSAVYPTFIGYNGKVKQYNEEHMGHINSWGQAVPIDSLFEAQLAQRLGYKPQWLDPALEQWDKMRASYL